MALIEDYTTELSTPACDPGSAIYVARVSLAADVAKVLPYVNATVTRAQFLQDPPILVWKQDDHGYALRPRELSINNIEDKCAAQKLVREMVERINDIWERREEMEPSYASYSPPKVLDLFKLLPRSNCKQCGLPTCMAYATGLSKGNNTLEDCPALSGEECAEQLKALRELLS
ncbi:MAG: (Fe-S)-binding protein [Candidatus Geothermincolia bacterium]